MDIEKRVLNVLNSLCDSNEIYENKDLDLFENRLLDSFGVIELVVALEEEFNISLDPSEIDRQDIETPNKLVNYVSNLIG